MIWLGFGCLAGAFWYLLPSDNLIKRLRITHKSKTQPRIKLLVISLILIFYLTIQLYFGLWLLGWIVVVTLVVGTVFMLATSTRKRANIQQRRQETVRAIGYFAGQLNIGQIPAVALARVAKDSEILNQAVATLNIGGNVSEALRLQSELPGYEGLFDLAKAWELSAISGAPMAVVMEKVADRLKEDQETESLVTSELAATRATGKILAALPIVGITMGFLAGGHPVEFIINNLVGQWLFVLGVMLATLGVFWIEKLANLVK